MSKRAEQAAKEIFKDGIELFGRRDKNNNLVIHPETMVGILRNAAQRGYELAEKDLALTWEDIKAIDELLTLVYDSDNEEGYYTRVLEEFNRKREEK